MRFNTLAIMFLLSCIAASSNALASDNTLDITINVVGPNQDVQGAIENQINIPQGHSDHSLAGTTGPRGENLQENNEASDAASEAQQTQESTQQIEQQDTQDATQQTQPDN